MNKTTLFLLLTWISGFVFFQRLQASDRITSPRIIKDSLKQDADSIGVELAGHFHGKFIKNIPPPDQKKKKFVCSLFALPFPCGFVGAHRVMLGTSPWIPVVYVATFGGCFGLLPLIDFCFITFSKDITAFENNPHIFMWAK